ncbi:MAG: hypothetical protein JO081_04670 [Alphaproteobacteria bacterium]|nr:hypothetical protein [Alphaproteobacteria bacterium]
MTRHAYPGSAMVGDYLRAGVGFIPAMAILVSAPIGPVATGLSAGFAALFGVFGLRTALRHVTQIEATETGLSASGPLATTIRWAELNRIKLAYYSTRRDRRDGWMQLELRARGASLRLDSRIEGFEQLVEQSARAAAEHGVEISAATAANMEALGIRNPDFCNLPDIAERRA